MHIYSKFRNFNVGLGRQHPWGHRTDNGGPKIPHLNLSQLFLYDLINCKCVDELFVETMFS